MSSRQETPNCIAQHKQLHPLTPASPVRRFNARDPSRSNLFSAYDSQQQSRPPSSNSHAKPHNGYGHAAPAFSAYPGGGGGGGHSSLEAPRSTSSPSFRSATPNQRGQYSDAVLSELESQNDEQLEGMSAKVKMLKEVTLRSLAREP